MGYVENRAQSEDGERGERRAGACSTLAANTHKALWSGLAKNLV